VRRLCDDTGRVLLHHTVTGSGPALLLLHSTVCDSRQWDPQRVLANGRTLVTVDLRGFGASPLPPEPYDDARDVLDVLDHLGLETAAVVGSSGGGHVGLQLASTEPGRVPSLVLLCSAGPGVEPTADLRSFAAQEQALLEDGDVDAATELNVRTWLGPDADDRARESVRGMQRHTFEVQLAAGQQAHDQAHEPPDEPALAVDLAAIRARTTVVAGRHDMDFFRLLARHLAAAIPAATHVELDWAGHLPNLERPDETTALIARAIDGEIGGPWPPSPQNGWPRV
jgi:pimeloyl-ACP methyl ester carboxylesterase